MAPICVALFPSLSHFGMFAPRILLWEAFVSLALLGYGLGLLRVLRLQRLPLAVAACTGVAVWLLVGGWLNLANLATRGVLLALLGVGFLLGLWELTRPPMRERLSSRLHGLTRNTFARNAAVPIAFYFLLVFAAGLRPMLWNKFDDPQAYMAYADKAAAFGSLQSDPFSERRINTGLGGGIFLNSTMLAGADDSAMGYIDGGFGYLVYILSVWSLARALGLSSRRAVLLLYFIPLFMLGKLNLTVVNLSIAFFLTILLLLLRCIEEDRLPPRIALLLGLLFGAACTVKSSNIPFVGLTVALCGIAFAVRARSLRSLVSFCLPALAIGLMVLPWMLQLHHDQGTYLFPNLGRGFHTSAYGLLPLPAHTAPPLQSLLIAVPVLFMVLGAGFFTYPLTRERPAATRLPVLSFLIAGFLSTAMITVSLAGESIDRFTMPISVACLLLFVALALSALRTSTHKLALAFAAVFTLVCLGYFSNIMRRREMLFPDPALIVTLTGHNSRPKGYMVALDAGTMAHNSATVRRAQDAIPAGQTILEATETAYGYDWHRNPIYIADYPGMAGLPPGPPIFRDAEAMREYLLDCGIHYVIYDRSLYVDVDFESFRQHPQLIVNRNQWKTIFNRSIELAPWGRMEYYIENHTREQFEEIARHHSVVYAEGPIEVIRLD